MLLLQYQDLDSEHNKKGGMGWGKENRVEGWGEGRQQGKGEMGCGRAREHSYRASKNQL